MPVDAARAVAGPRDCTGAGSGTISVAAAEGVAAAAGEVRARLLAKPASCTAGADATADAGAALLPRLIGLAAAGCALPLASFPTAAEEGKDTVLVDGTLQPSSSLLIPSPPSSEDGDDGAGRFLPVVLASGASAAAPAAAAAGEDDDAEVPTEMPDPEDTEDADES